MGVPSNDLSRPICQPRWTEVVSMFSSEHALGARVRTTSWRVLDKCQLPDQKMIGHYLSPLYTQIDYLWSEAATVGPQQSLHCSTKTTPFDKSHRDYLCPEAAMVHCGGKLHHLRSHRETICGQGLPQFIVARCCHRWLISLFADGIYTNIY